jgi:hypothetical protein
MHRVLLALAFTIPFLGGCASLSRQDPLQVTLAGVEPLEGEGLEMRLLVKLRVQNPNDAPVVYDGAYVKLEVQDRTFATGVSDASGDIPRFGESIVEVPLTISVMSVARQVLAMRDGKPADQISYSMSGKLNRGAFGSTRFKAAGEFSLKPRGPAEAADTT